MVVFLLISVFAKYVLFWKSQEMYKAFVASQQENAAKKETPDVELEVNQKVNKIWKEIDDYLITNKKTASNKKNEIGSKTTNWKFVRIFVSSTFADFFNEREVLVKKVFPELREWCQDRNLKLIECDLRWGVPRDTPSEQTIAICLEEIDKCIEVSDGLPLFIGLLGDRYGWIPSEIDVPPEVRDKYKWVDGTSITSMEVLHGAYRTRNPNAAFFIRNSSVTSNIPQSHISSFVDKDPLSSGNLKVLKEKITAAFPGQVFNYDPKFKHLTDGTNNRQIVLEGFDDFAKNVLEFFKTAILRIHPNQEHQEIDPLLQEQETQWSYILDKANNRIGRQAEKDILIRYLTEGIDEHFEKTGSSKSQIRKIEDWDISDSDRPICVVEAPSGWGKTTLICSVIKEVVENRKDWQVFYHAVGGTPNSVQVEWLLKRLLSALIPTPNDDDNEVIKDGKLEALTKLLRKAFTDFRQKQSERLIIILDNLNGLSNSDTIDHLSWLPPLLPSNISCIVSTNQHLPTKSRLYEHPTLKMTLSTMTQEELADIATQYLGTFSKKLHPSQLTSLMTTTGVDNPLWLSLMVEELRIFGSFNEMDQMISELPKSLDEFLVQVFDRLVKEDQNQNLVKKVLCLIACSRYGIPSDQVLQVCGDAKAQEPISLLEWLQVKRLLKPYLRMSGFLDEMITFSHDAVCKAVMDHYLSTESDICYWNTIWADYFQYSCDKPRLKVWNLPYHLKRARQHQRMVEFMTKDKDSSRFIAPFLRSNYLKDCRCRMLADPVIPNNSPMMLCKSCSNKPQGFNPAQNWSNKTCCVICGAHNAGRNPVNAHACMMHAQRFGPDIAKCVLCNFMVSTKGNKAGVLTPSHAILCDNCSFGNGGKICAVLSCGRRW